jgi:hypothetical protein
MVSNIPHNSEREEQVIEIVTNILFPDMEFDVESKDMGRTTAIVFKPV